MVPEEVGPAQFDGGGWTPSQGRAGAPLQAQPPDLHIQGAAQRLRLSHSGQRHLEHGGPQQGGQGQEVPDGLPDHQPALQQQFAQGGEEAGLHQQASQGGSLDTQCLEDYALILRQMSFEVHCMNFLRNPSWLEDLPDAAVVDSPDRLRMRAEYDHRVALPIGAVWIDIKTFFLGKRKWAVAFQYYRCAGGLDQGSGLLSLWMSWRIAPSLSSRRPPKIWPPAQRCHREGDVREGLARLPRAPIAGPLLVFSPENPCFPERGGQRPVTLSRETLRLG